MRELEKESHTGEHTGERDARPHVYQKVKHPENARYTFPRRYELRVQSSAEALTATQIKDTKRFKNQCRYCSGRH